MQLRIISTNGRDFTVSNAATGEALEGVKQVKWESHFPTGPRVVLALSGASIDMTIDADRVETFGLEDNKYAAMPLKEVHGLRWIKKLVG